MVETITYRKIGAQDIQFGTNTFQVELIGGKVVTMEEVNLSHLLGTLTNDSVVFVAGGTLSEDNANFHYDSAATELFVPLVTGGDGASETLTLESTSHGTKGVLRLNPTGGGVVVGGTTASGAFDVKATGATQLRIDNVSSVTTGDPYLTFAIAGTGKFSIGVDDSDSDRLEFHQGNDLTGTPIMLFDGDNVAIGDTIPLGRLHVKTADAGAITPNPNGDELILEGSVNSGMSILSGNTATGNIYFADNGSPLAGHIFFNHNTDTMNMAIGGTTWWSMTSSEIKATIPLRIETADAGAITPNPNGDELIIEGSADSGLSILSGATSTGNIYFADTGSATAAAIFFNHNTDTMNMAIGGTTLWSMANDETLLIGSTGDITFKGSGKTFLGQSTTNAFMGKGITIDAISAASTNEYVACKSSNVIHGMTALADTNTFFAATNWNTGTGGTNLRGFSEDRSGIVISGYATNEDTSAGGSSVAAVMAGAHLKSGTSSTTLGNTANLFAVTNGFAAKLLIKGDGDVYNAGGSTAMVTFDTHDDVQLLTALRTLSAPVDFRQQLGTWVDDHLDILEQHGVIVRDNPDNPQEYFTSQQGLTGLLIDTIRQLAGRVTALEQRGLEHSN